MHLIRGLRWLRRRTIPLAPRGLSFRGPVASATERVYDSTGYTQMQVPVSHQADAITLSSRGLAAAVPLASERPLRFDLFDRLGAEQPLSAVGAFLNLDPLGDEDFSTALALDIAFDPADA